MPDIRKPNRLFPAFVAINYVSAYGQHKQILPTLKWNGAGLGDAGTFDTHDEVGVDAITMVTGLITAKLGNLPDTTNIINWTIYNLPTDTSIPQPVYTAAVGAPGELDTLTGQAQAVQWTMAIRTTAFGILKFVELDRPCNDVWGNVTAMDAYALAIYNELTDAGNGWAGRDDGKPGGFMGISISLNKRLRRKYSMI